ncbi:hypothetical protein ACTSKR_10590 [Chitinibacteraceae bacterium HSL-7]
MTILPAIMHDQITALLDAGDALFEKGRDEDALAKYREAESLLPTEKERFEASAIVLAAVADTLFQLGRFSECEEKLLLALECEGGDANAFVWLRLGQCAFEGGRLEAAHAAFNNARVFGGAEIFEDEDPRYLAALDQ